MRDTESVSGCAAHDGRGGNASVRTEREATAKRRTHRNVGGGTALEARRRGGTALYRRLGTARATHRIAGTEPRRLRIGLGRMGSRRAQQREESDATE